MSSSSSESDNAEQAEGSITFATVCKDAREGNKDNDATVKTTFQLKIKAGKKIPVGKTEHKLEGYCLYFPLLPPFFPNHLLTTTTNRSQFTILVERKESSWFIIYCHSKDEKEFYSRTSTTISLVGSRTYRRECNDEIARVFAENNHVVYIQLGFCKKQPSMIYQSKVLEDLWNNAKTMDFTLISKDAMETHCHSAVCFFCNKHLPRFLNLTHPCAKNRY
jgi:hypothetical protein